MWMKKSNITCLAFISSRSSLFCYSLKRASIEEKGIVRVNSLSEKKTKNNQESIKIWIQLDLEIWQQREIDKNAIITQNLFNLSTEFCANVNLMLSVILQ